MSKRPGVWPGLLKPRLLFKVIIMFAFIQTTTSRYDRVEVVSEFENTIRIVHNKKMETINKADIVQGFYYQN